MSAPIETPSTPPGGEGHTAGPWRITRVNPADIGDWTDHGGYEISAAGVQISYVWNASRRLPVDGGPQSEGPPFGSANGEADARLIAAAPDLLSALRAMVALWDGLPDGDTPARHFAPAALAQARAALSKLGDDQ